MLCRRLYVRKRACGAKHPPKGNHRVQSDVAVIEKVKQHWKHLWVPSIATQRRHDHLPALPEGTVLADDEESLEMDFCSGSCEGSPKSPGSSLLFTRGPP